jgi:membrane protein
MERKKEHKMKKYLSPKVLAIGIGIILLVANSLGLILLGLGYGKYALISIISGLVLGAILFLILIAVNVLQIKKSKQKKLNQIVDLVSGIAVALAFVLYFVNRENIFTWSLIAVVVFLKLIMSISEYRENRDKISLWNMVAFVCMEIAAILCLIVNIAS